MRWRNNMPRPYKRKPIEERFWKYVNKDTESGCWEWIGAIERNGYGRFKLNGKMILAHRLSYELHKGPIPSGMCCLHSCDNRRCVKPDHLSIGTHKENIQDKIDKNRQAKGSMHGKSKLNEDQVLLIKKRISSGERNIDIAKEYDVCIDSIFAESTTYGITNAKEII